MIDITHYIVLSGLLFIIGILGILVKRQSLIGLLLSVELLLLAVNINMIGIGVFIGKSSHQIFSLFIITVAAAEAAIALALVLRYFKERKSIEVQSATNLEG